ncbi:MAG: TonB-dependent receptor, partial [Ignavibacteria bacterium]|nr:TonB-dependent receptor [Ignavibacteria bacterium]
QNTISINQYFEKAYSNFIATSTTAFTNYYDDMIMDQDFTSAPIFTLEQMQNRNSITEELLFKSKTSSNYKWTTGFFGFYDNLTPNATVLFKNDGINKLIESNVQVNIPTYVTYDILDTNFRIDNTFKNPTYGLALYHQSSYDNFITDGLTITAGLRFDYAHNKLSYNTGASLTQSYNMIQGPFTIIDTLPTKLEFTGETNKDNFQVLPKLSFNYNFNDNARLYVSAARGMKSGGYNIQMLSDLAQNDLRYNMIDELKGSISKQMATVGVPQQIIDLVLGKLPVFKKIDTMPGVLGNMLWYSPEQCLNLELGTYMNFLNGKLTAELSVYYMDVTDLQLTKFSPNGFGRMLSNAGSATSKGFETSLSTRLIDNLNISVDYGFAYSTFTDYLDTLTINDSLYEIDYSGKRVPYAPQQTLSIVGQYMRCITEGLCAQLTAQYQGTGNIYWDEANSLSQKYYNTVNAKFALHYGTNTMDGEGITLEIWANNLLNTKYNTFYFESLGNRFFQMGRPASFGATIKVKF